RLAATRYTPTHKIAPFNPRSSRNGSSSKIHLSARLLAHFIQTIVGSQTYRHYGHLIDRSGKTNCVDYGSKGVGRGCAWWHRPRNGECALLEQTNEWSNRVSRQCGATDLEAAVAGPMVVCDSGCGPRSHHSR